MDIENSIKSIRKRQQARKKEVLSLHRHGFISYDELTKISKEIDTYYNMCENTVTDTEKNKPKEDKLQRVEEVMRYIGGEVSRWYPDTQFILICYHKYDTGLYKTVFNIYDTTEALKILKKIIKSLDIEE